MNISQLKLNPKNPRVIKDEKFRQLCKSIQEFPEMMEKRPMVCVTDTDGKLYPLGGNMRLKALKELKYKDIPDSWVVLADDWTVEQRNEFTIKDNVGLGEWNWDELSEDWDADLLKDWGLDVPEFNEQDYSDKNKEIDVDSYNDEMTLTFKLTEAEYKHVTERLSLLNSSKEIALLILTKYEI